jgi:hypothetical protein
MAEASPARWATEGSSMTWKEFKAAMEKAGVKDDDPIYYVDVGQSSVEELVVERREEISRDRIPGVTIVEDRGWAVFDL